MPVEVRVPQLGESVFEATVGRWLKNPGDRVSKGEALAELETDKVSLDVAADADGVLSAVGQPAGSVVGVGDVIGLIDDAVAPIDGAVAETPPPAAAPLAADAVASVPDAPATPLARRLAEDRDIDVRAVQGTGARGRVTRDDIERVGQATASDVVARSVAPSDASAPAPEPRREERVRLSRRRLTIARRLVEAQQTAAMLTTFNEVDMSAVMAVRARHREPFKERHGVGLGYMSFFTRAVVGALRAFPRLNAEIQGDEMVLKLYYDIGIAVGVDEGLVVPVVRDADRKTFAAIEREIVDLATRARSNTLSLADLQGGTFTITNGGIYGSLLSTPILNTPQVGILGMHKIEERPVVVAGVVAVRPMMYLALSYDHRLVDGSEAVRFLVRVKALIEDPEILLLDG
ncbi:MAG: 2-oxoglutarate dehydrogenase complex dihydrolipoyllysine-residue succinyltransferase [Chloroflexi bacterium]|nr:2-oxoglutarate dehydrogenase complex dihydrolipoyllysine-residue succinyltransferase [Chloroflexota bacterium]